ncbi:acyl-CoA dehydrogenase [Olivibacter sp. XZL3]|uniref:acyl-CoA dehydrogenase n=1 Tax=Olivibacter sp. XZL3 TaxID=1735116 RepID=UPI0010665C65|nr:acyl-CoA dehydrogenase [Olivibacter sp. XZL3]
MKLLQQLKDLTDELRNESLHAELKNCLTKEQLGLIYENKLFNLFVPKEYGGLDLSLPEALQVEELLAEIDGSLGWTVTLCSGANMFVGFLDQEIAPSIFRPKEVCFGGSGQASGRAEIFKEGFLVTGRWRYATGAPHNTVFTANCQIYLNGEPVLSHTNEPLIKSFFFFKEEVTVLNEWNTMGLKATASHSFEVNNLFVDKNRSFRIDPESATLNQQIYRYPFQQFAELTLCINTLGMTTRFLDLCVPILNARFNVRDGMERDVVLHQYLSKAKREMADLRRLIYEVAAATWKQLGERDSIEPSLLNEISKYSRRLVRTAQHWVCLLYPYCGMKAANPMEEINRVWRDLFTASQHSLLAVPDEFDN